MKKYRKKPVIIEAVQWTGSNYVEMEKFITSNFWHMAQSECLEIETLEGNHRAIKGDWIIKGIKGEFYPCKPDIFEATYDPV